MTVLTPGCDPDMSTTGAPFGRPPEEFHVRSVLVLLAITGLSAALATADAAKRDAPASSGTSVPRGPPVGGSPASSVAPKGTRVGIRFVPK